uniref:Uncharacterized protein n=1 Tax=Globodera rostochiensis TaxID=31243 RepID=A0A914HI74_GLORO
MTKSFQFGRCHWQHRQPSRKSTHFSRGWGRLNLSLRRHPRGGQHTGLGRRSSNFTTTTAAITRASNKGNQIAPKLSDLVIYMHTDPLSSARPVSNNYPP